MSFGFQSSPVSIYKMNFIQGKYLGFFAQDFLDGLHFAFVCDLWITTIWTYHGNASSFVVIQHSFR